MMKKLIKYWLHTMVCKVRSKIADFWRGVAEFCLDTQYLSTYRRMEYVMEYKKRLLEECKQRILEYNTMVHVFYYDNEPLEVFRDHTAFIQDNYFTPLDCLSDDFRVLDEQLETIKRLIDLLRETGDD